MPHYATPSDYVYQILTADQVDLMRRLDLVTEYAITSQFIDRALQGEGGVQIGSPVGGGTPTYFLYVDAFGNLANQAATPSGALVTGSTGVTPNLGAGNPTEVLYIKLDGTVWSDPDFIRDSTTFDTRISKINGTTANDFLVGNAGIGVDAVILHRLENSNGHQGFSGLVDGSVISSPFSVVGIIESDDGANLQSFSIFAPDGNTVSWSDSGSVSSANISMDATNGLILQFQTIGAASKFRFFADNTGIGYGDNNVGLFILPTGTPTAGQVLGSIAGGYGILDWVTPGGGGTGVQRGGAATSFSPGMIQYIDNSGIVQTGDSQAVRDDTTHETAISSTQLEAGYTSGFFMNAGLGPYDPFSFGGHINIFHWNPTAGGVNKPKGSIIQSDSFVAQMHSRDASIAGIDLISLIDARTDGGGLIEVSLSDQGTANYEANINILNTGVFQQYFYDSNLGKLNKTDLNSTQFIVTSDLHATTQAVFQLDFLNQIYAIGDFANSVNGWAMGLNGPNKLGFIGDSQGVGNGMLVFADDLNQRSGFGDVGVVKNGTNFIVQDSPQIASSGGKHPVLTPLAYHPFLGPALNDAAINGVYTGPNSNNYTISLQLKNAQKITIITATPGIINPGDSVVSSPNGFTGTVDSSSGSVIVFTPSADMSGETSILDITTGVNITAFTANTGVQDWYAWSATGGGSAPLLPCSITPVLMNNGISVDFGSITGHTALDVWTFTANNHSGIGLYLDYANGDFVLGDALDNWFGTKFIVDDDVKSFIFRTDPSTAVDLLTISGNSSSVLLNGPIASGTNISGATLNIQGGLSTGNRGGLIKFLVPMEGSSGSAVNAPYDVGHIAGVSGGVDIVFGDLPNTMGGTKFQINDPGQTIVGHATKVVAFDSNNGFNGLEIDYVTDHYTFGHAIGGFNYVEIVGSSGEIYLSSVVRVITQAGHTDLGIAAGSSVNYGQTINLSTGAYDIAIGASGGNGATTVNLITTGPGGGEIFILSDFGGQGTTGGNSITVDAGVGNSIRSPTNPLGAQTYAFTADGEVITIKRIISPSGSTGQIWKIEQRCV